MRKLIFSVPGMIIRTKQKYDGNNVCNLSGT